MSATLTINTSAFLEELNRIMPELQATSRPIIDRLVTKTATELKAVYPAGKTHQLRDGVQTESAKLTAGGVIGQVHSWSKYAHMWEFGTQDRHTSKGWERGRSPSHRQEGMITISSRNRRQMVIELREVVRAYGFDIGFSI
jgi:hypothetical protein